MVVAFFLHKTSLETVMTFACKLLTLSSSHAANVHVHSAETTLWFDSRTQQSWLIAVALVATSATAISHDCSALLTCQWPVVGQGGALSSGEGV